MFGFSSSFASARLPFSAYMHVHLVALEQRGQREDVAQIVVDDEHVALRELRIVLREAAQHALLALGEVGLHAVQEQRGLVEQPLHRRDVLDDHGLREAVQALLVLLGQLAARVDDHGQAAVPRVGLDPLDQLEARHARAAGDRARRSRRASASSDCERALARDDRGGLDVAVADQIADRLALDRIVLDDEQLLDALLDELADVREALP